MKISFTLLYRTIKNDKFLTAAKILGLAIGFLVFMATAIFVQKQFAFDSFHQKRDRIYRLNLLGSFEEIDATEMGIAHYAMEPFLRQNYPEIEEIVRLFDTNQGFCQVGGDKAFYDRAMFVDSTFFEVFDFPLVYGQKKGILSRPNTVVISEEISRALFGDEDPVGKAIAVRYGHWVISPTPTEFDKTVTGVFGAMPNSHMQFDVLTSFASKNDLENVKWSGPVAHTYLLLKEGASAEQLDQKLRSFYADHVPKLEHMYQGKLQPLADIHLGSKDIKSDVLNWQKFDRRYVDIFIVLALVILVIAAINFVQLSIGQLTDRFKVAAIRRILGGSKWDILRQYYFETTVLCLAAIVLAGTGILLLQPFFKNALDTNINLGTLLEHGTYLWLLGSGVVIVAVVGFVPTAITHSLAPIKDLSGIQQGGGSYLMTKVLIVVQLALSFGFLGGAIVIFNQTNYLLASNGSFEKEFILQVPLSEEAKKAFEAMKQEASQLSGVAAVTGASNKFGTIGGLDLKLKIEGEEKILILPTLMVDPDFLRAFRIEVTEGKDFTEWGKNEFIVNKAMVKNFGWEDPIGEQIGFAYGRPGKVVGVVEDFNYNSLHEDVEPFCFWSTNYLRVMSIKANTGNVQPLLDDVEGIWSKHVNDMPFTYTFMDDDIADMYKTEAATNKIVSYLTIVAGLLSSLGIYALSYLISRRKTREVSIKKVLGAPIPKLFLSFSWQFYKMMLLAIILIAPITFLVMRNWLSDFAYRTEVPALLLVSGVLLMVLISSLALISNLMRLVSVNPTTALREK